MKCEDIEATLDSSIPTLNLLKFAPIKEEIKNEPDCYATQLLLENTNESLVHTILKTEKTSDVPSTAVCEEHIIKDELCFDESSIDVKENTIIKLSHNFTNELQINNNQLKSTNFVKTDPNIGQSGVKKYQCDYCCMFFTNKKYLKTHTTIHRRQKHKCGVCGKCFTKIELKIHLSHSGHRPYNCDICGKCFASKNYLKIHICTHDGQRGHRPYKCDICGRGFNRKEYLKSHLPTHSGQKLHKCDVCGKSFSRKGSLTTHMLAHSGQQRSYKCDICSKYFTNKAFLKNHLLAHSGQKPYKCNVCGKCFIRNDHFKNHLRTHSGQNTYKYDNCDKSYKIKDALENHSLAHSPLICDICGKCFNSKNNIKIHLLNHHSKELSRRTHHCGTI